MTPEAARRLLAALGVDASDVMQRPDAPYVDDEGASGAPAGATLEALHRHEERLCAAKFVGRFARAAEHAGRGAAAALQLFGPHSLVVAMARVCKANMLANQSASAGKSDALGQQAHHRAWAALCAASPILLERLRGGSLLPGACRPEEVDFARFSLHAEGAAEGRDCSVEFPGEVANWHALCVGYDALLTAATVALLLLANDVRIGVVMLERHAKAHALVLAAVDAIPAKRLVAPFPYAPGSEKGLAHLVDTTVTPALFSGAFVDQLLAKWRSQEVRGALEAHNTLNTAAVWSTAHTRNGAARVRDDVAAHGLRRCALPSCGRSEVRTLVLESLLSCS